MKNFYIFLLFALFSIWGMFHPPGAEAQSFSSPWNTRLGGSSTDSVSFVYSTSDGGYLVGGSSNSNAGPDKGVNRKGGFDFWVIKLNASGARMFDKTFGGTNDDYLKCVAPTSDGGYLLGGISNSNANGDKTALNKGGFDAWVIKIDANGNKVWDKSYGSNGTEDLNHIAPISGGGFILCATSNSGIGSDKSAASKGGNDYWVVTIDVNGVKTNDFTIGGSGDDQLKWGGFYNTNTDYFYLSGTSNSGISGDKGQASFGGNDYWVVSINRNSGVVIDGKTYGGTGDDIVSGATRTLDNNFLVSGSSNSNISGNKTENSFGGYDYWTLGIETDVNGLIALVKQKTLGTTQNDWARIIKGVDCKGVSYLAGTSNGGINNSKTTDAIGSSDLWIVRLNEDLTARFDRSYGGSATNTLGGFAITSNGGFVAAGTVTGNGGDITAPSRGDRDYWVHNVNVNYSRGQISSHQTVCISGNTGTLSISGNDEKVIRWESATNAAFNPVTSISNTQTNYNFLNLTANTFFRAVTLNDACKPIFSDSVIITVNPLPTTANAGVDDTVCYPDISQNGYTLRGNQPVNGVSEWRFISGPSVPTLTPVGNLEARVDFQPVGGCYLFEYSISNNPCQPSRDTVRICIEMPIVPGFISASSTFVCSGSPVTLTLNNYSGTSIQWQEQPGCQGNFNNISGAIQQVYTTQPLVDTICFRAVVSGLVCPPSTTAPIQINVGFLDPGTMDGDRTVCRAANSGILTVSGFSGNIIRWEKSLDDFVNNIITIANTNSTYTFSSLIQTTWYRAVTTSQSCSLGYTPKAKITVSPVTVGGRVIGPIIACSGSPIDSLKLINQVGDVLSWEKSTDGGSTWIPIANTNTYYLPGMLNMTTAFRAVVKSGGCLTVRSQQITVTIQPGPRGGTLSSPATVCAGSNSGVLVLSNYSGRIIRWEKSTDSWNTVTTIGNTTNFYVYQGLMDTTSFRVVVMNNACPNYPVFSTVVTIVVNPQVIPGRVQGLTPFNTCINQLVDTLTLVGYTGNIIRWEKSNNPNFVPVTTINNTTDTYIDPNVLTQTTYYRAVVGSGVCPSMYSTPDTAIANLPPVGGVTTANPMVVCSGYNNGLITLTGYSGYIKYWEVSYDNFVTSTALINQYPTITFANLTQSACFRALLVNGSCPEAFSSITCITVDTNTTGGRVIQDMTICSGSNQGSLLLSGFSGNIIRWESSNNNFVNIQTIANTIPYYTFTNLTQTTRFRAVVQADQCTSYSTAATVTVLPQAIGGFVGPDATVCGGQNAGQIFLTGHNGVVSYWESSTDQFQTIQPIGNTTTSLIYNNLTQTTCYRSWVRVGNCVPVVSQNVSCVIVQPSGIANAGPDKNVCGTSTALVAGNFQPGIQGIWSFESAPQGANPTLSQIGLLAQIGNLTVPGNYKYRFIVINAAPCENDTDWVNIKVGQDLSNSRITTNDTSFCETDSIELAAISSGNVLWQRLDSGNILNPTSLTTRVKDLTYGVNRFVLMAMDSLQVCISKLDTVTITRYQTSMASLEPINRSGRDTICPGETVILDASQHIGDIVRWEYSEDNFVTHQNFPPPVGNSITLSFVQRSIWVRFVVKSGNCSEAISPIRKISVLGAIQRGVITGDVTYCSQSNAGALTLTGHSGNIVRWESSQTNFQTFDIIPNTSNVLQYSNVPNTTCYRAVLQNGNCPTGFSDTACVTITNGGNPGVITGPTSVCAGTNSGTLVWGGSSNTILRWEVSTDLNNWTAINNTNSILNFSNLTQDACYRVVSKNGNCPEIISPIFCVDVFPQPVGGSIIPQALTLCTGQQEVLTLRNHEGQIIHWEKSNDGGNTWSSISGTDSILSVMGGANETRYRAVVQNACGLDTSSIAIVIPGGNSQPGNIIGLNTVCVGQADSLKLVQNNGTVIRWEISLDPNFINLQTIAGPSTLLVINPQQTTYVRAVVQGGNCPPSFSSPFVVNVSGSLPRPDVSQSQSMVCYGETASLVATGPTPGRYFWFDENGTQLNQIGLISGTAFNSPPITNSNCFYVEYREGNCISGRNERCLTFNPNMPAMPNIAGYDSVICVNETTTIEVLAPGVPNYRYLDQNMQVIETMAFPAIKTFTFSQVGVYTFYVQGINGNCAGIPRQITIRATGGQGDGGILTGPLSACNGGSFTLGLQNFNGTIIRWESSTDNFITTTTINNLSPVLLVNNFNATTAYRAVVQGCGFHLSNVVIVTFDPCLQTPVITQHQQNGSNCGNTVITVQGHFTKFTQTTNVYLSATPTSISDPNLKGINVTVINDSLLKFTIPSGVSPSIYFVLVENGDGNNQNTWPATQISLLIQQGVCNTGKLLNLSQSTVPNCSDLEVTLTGDTTTFLSLTRIMLSTSQTSIVGNNQIITYTVIDDKTLTFRVPRTIDAGTYFIIVENGGFSNPNLNFPKPIQIIVTAPVQCPTGTLTVVNPTNVNKCDTSQVSVTGVNVDFNATTRVFLSPVSDTLIPGNSFLSPGFTVLTQTTLKFRMPINLPVGTYFVMVENGGFQPGPPFRNYPAVLPVIVTEFPTSGFVSSNQTVTCPVDIQPLTLTGHMGTVLNWESSTDGFLNQSTVINNSTATLMPLPVNGTVCYRAIVQGLCGASPSDFACVTMQAGNNGGSITPAQSAVCLGQLSSTFLLSGQQGVIIRWESSFDNFATVNSINNTSPLLLPQVIQQNVCFRAVLDNPQCGIVYSNPGCVTVGQSSVGGTTSSGVNQVCPGDNIGEILLANEVGQVIFWESSPTNNFQNISVIPSTDNFLPFENIASFTCYRAVVQNAGCAEARSSATCIFVIPQAGAGVISGAGSVCYNGTKQLVLAANARPILSWEYSTDCPGFTNPQQYPSNSNTIVTMNLTQNTCFRAIVEGAGGCAYSYSAPVTVTVSTLKIDTVYVMPAAGCASAGQIKIAATGGVGPYIYSIIPAAGINNNGTFTNVPAGVYETVVTDAKGCQRRKTVEVLQGVVDTIQITEIFNIQRTFAGIRWQTPQNPNGAKYRLRYRVKGSLIWTETGLYTQTSTTISGLQYDTDYEVEVRYECTQGNFVSAWSDPMEFRTLTNGDCSSQAKPYPGGRRIVSLTKNSVTLKWNLVAGAPGYIISYGLPNLNVNTWSTFLVCSPGDSITINNLAPNTRYGFRIRTNCGPCNDINQQLMSSWSPITLFTTPSIRGEDNEIMTTNNNVVSVYPNPNKGTFVIDMESTENQLVNIKVMDIMGRMILNQDVQAISGNNSFPIELNGESSGVYLLQMIIGNEVKTIRVVVE